MRMRLRYGDWQNGIWYLRKEEKNTNLKLILALILIITSVIDALSGRWSFHALLRVLVLHRRGLAAFVCGHFACCFLQIS